MLRLTGFELAIRLFQCKRFNRQMFHVLPLEFPRIIHQSPFKKLANPSEKFTKQVNYNWWNNIYTISWKTKWKFCRGWPESDSALYFFSLAEQGFPFGSTLIGKNDFKRLIVNFLFRLSIKRNSFVFTSIGIYLT